MISLVAVLAGLLGPLSGATPAWAATTWTGSLGGATAYPDDFWNSGGSAVWGDFFSPFYWQQGQDIVHTVSFYYSGSVAGVGVGFQIRGQAGTTFLEPARILDEANGACPGPGVFEYSLDGVAWSSDFVTGAKYILYQTNTSDFINQSPRDGTECLIGVLATADRPTTAQSTTNADLYQLMDATPANVHDSALYRNVSTSESDFTQQAFSLTADRSGSVSAGDVVTFTATMTSLKTGTALTARSHVIDLSRLLDDADLSPTITSSTGSAVLSGDTIVWSSGAAIPNGAVVTVTFQATVKAGGDADLRTVVDGPTSTATLAFNLNNGPRSNCQTVPAIPNRPGQGDAIWANRQLLSAATVAAMQPALFASTLGSCAVVLHVGLLAPDVVADAGGPYRIDEGAASLTLDATGTLAGPTAVYSWDLDGDGNFDDVTGVTPTLTATHLAGLDLGDGPASRVVTLRVTEDVTIETAQATITVDNLPPTVTAVGPTGHARVGTAVSVTLTASDPWPPDVAVPQYRIDWGDGTVQSTTTDTPQHTYSRAGSYPVTVTVTDKDDAVSAPAHLTIVVDPAVSPTGTPTPTSTATPPPLPATGAGPMPLLAAGVGLVLLAAGSVLLHLGRRAMP